MSLDVVYLTYERLEFTRFTFEKLLQNTAWDRVTSLQVFDDGSSDGTREWLDVNLDRAPVKVIFRSEKHRSPPATMNQYLASTEADLFAKIDSDTVVPPGWLDAMLSVLDAHPDVELLGMEAGRGGHALEGFDGVYGYEPCTHIGGVGVMRTAAFTSRPPIDAHGRYGFDHWQVRHDPVRGWVAPDIRVCSLDMLPVEPWRSLSDRYISHGWQRAWPTYDPKMPETWEWFWPEEALA